MTENLLQKLEEKMVVMLTEIEDLRKEVQHLNHENSALKTEREGNFRKLQDLISLLDTVNVAAPAAAPTNITVLVQDQAHAS